MEPGRAAQTKSYVWAQMTDGSGKDGTGPPIRLFTYSPSRSTKTAMTLYAGIRPGAVLMTDGPLVTPDDLALRPGRRDAPRIEDMSLEDVEAFLVRKALDRHQRNVTLAARALGLSRSAMYRRLQRYGIAADR
ncbi:MAG: helix-turn-helix domain-containing protein [Vicinamibacteria bacterium]